MPLVRQDGQLSGSSYWAARCNTCDRWYPLGHQDAAQTLVYLTDQGWDWYSPGPTFESVVITCPACQGNHRHLEVPLP